MGVHTGKSRKHEKKRVFLKYMQNRPSLDHKKSTSEVKESGKET